MFWTQLAADPQLIVFSATVTAVPCCWSADAAPLGAAADSHSARAPAESAAAAPTIATALP
jgi:hypothetical protein